MTDRSHSAGRRPRRGRRLAVCAAAAVLLLAAPAVAEVVTTALEGRAQAGFASTGTAPGDAGTSLRQSWTTTLDEHRFTPRSAGRAGEVAGRALVARGGLLLVTAERADGQGTDLVAVDRANGAVRWTAPQPTAPGCLPVETDDGQLWALLRNPNTWQVGNHTLVPVDPRNGAADLDTHGIRGSWGQTEFLGCHGGIQELDDGRLVWLEQVGDRASLRVVDPDTQDSDRRVTEERTLDLAGRTVGQAWTLLPGTVDGEPVAVVTSHAGSTTRLHVVDLEARDRRAWSPTEADVLHTVDLPGGPAAATGLLAVGDALFVAAGPHGGRPGHVTRLDGDPDDLAVTWRSAGPTDAVGRAKPFDPRWLTVAGQVLVARDGGDLVGIDPRTGTVDWAWTAAGAQHLLADRAGDVLGVAGSEVVGVTPGGVRQAGGRLPSGIDHDEAVEVLAVDDRGRVLVMSTDASTGAARLSALGATSGGGGGGGGGGEPGDAWQPDPGEPTVSRHVGAGRVETAVQVAVRAFDRADVAVLARADAYPDALAGGPLAASLDGPLLLTDRAALPGAVRDELLRLGVQRVVLLGGEAAVGGAVERELRDTMGLEVERISGDTRFATARAVADRIGGDEAYLVEGANADPNRGWPDAVAVSGVASARGVPILLATRDVLPRQTIEALAGRDVTVIGGRAAIGDAVAIAADAGTRVSGANRWATSLAVVEHGLARDVDVDTLWVATGTSYPDALSAGAAAAATDGSLVLVHGTDVASTAASRAFLAKHGSGVRDLELVGGARAISPDVAAALVDARDGAR